MVKATILAISTLIGTIIGAGIFGIPYVLSKSGFTIGLLHIIAIGILILITMLYLGEVALRTKSDHHLTGYAEKYLGKKGKQIMLIALIVGIYSAALAYLIGISESLSFLIMGSTSYSLYMGITFWIIISLISYFGLKALEGGEFIGVSIIIILISTIVVFFIGKINLSNLTAIPSNSLNNYLMPFGVVLFAFLGFSTIPEVKRILKKEKHKMKISIILSILISAILYILFAAIVIGFKGTETPGIATIALGKPFIFLGILTMFTSYLAVSIAMIDTFKFDFNINKNKAWFFTIIIPIILFIILQITDTANFTTVLGIGGVLSGGLTSIVILITAYKAKYLGDRKPEYSLPINKTIIILLSLIFIIGTIAELINTF